MSDAEPATYEELHAEIARLRAELAKHPTRAGRLAIYHFRADPQMIELAKLGLMLPMQASVSEVVRAALALAAGEESPDGRVSRGGWRPRRGRVYVDRSTGRVRTA